MGGQDIKIIVLKNGAVKDFRLNTQCSAGNGYFLQAAAESLGIAIDDFADVAFTARQMPVFSYGCAVFLQSDIVNFQRQGWQPQEIIAGLAAVLPKNVFLYVAGVSNIANLGRRFLLQGGTQRNLAVVKAEVDFMRSHFFDRGEPEIFVHPHCGEAGAIGAALHVHGAVCARPAQQLHRHGRAGAVPLHHRPQRADALLFLQQPLRPDFHRGRGRIASARGTIRVLTLRRAASSWPAASGENRPTQQTARKFNASLAAVKKRESKHSCHCGHGSHSSLR